MALSRNARPRDRTPPMVSLARIASRSTSSRASLLVRRGSPSRSMANFTHSCTSCALRAECTKAVDGRSITVGPDGTRPPKRIPAGSLTTAPRDPRSSASWPISCVDATANERRCAAERARRGRFLVACRSSQPGAPWHPRSGLLAVGMDPDAPLCIPTRGLSRGVGSTTVGRRSHTPRRARWRRLRSRRCASSRPPRRSGPEDRRS